MNAIRFENDTLYLLDQTKLPREQIWLAIRDDRAAAAAIRDMCVRGAPAIGIAAAYGLALAARQADDWPPQARKDAVLRARAALAATRPTAVNLFWALDRCALTAARHENAPSLYEVLLREARAIHEEDVRQNKQIGTYGAAVVPPGARILTHCNAGSLATGGYGTALGVVYSAAEQGKVERVWVDETRPLLQGARLTALELMDAGVPCTLICDNMAASLMGRGEVDLVITGADRVARNGDAVNKIGTYGLAVLAHFHGIPFYVALPGSTVDLSLPGGESIPIEQRAAAEITAMGGQPIAPEDAAVYNPAFDLTPHSLITALITDKGLLYPPFAQNIAAAFAGCGDAEKSAP